MRQKRAMRAKVDQPARKTGWKSWTALVMLGLLGLTVGNWLRSSGPLGTDISGEVALAGLLTDDISPSYGPTDAVDDANDAVTNAVTGGQVTIILFTDYQCPACRAAHSAVHSAVQRDGNTRLIYRDFPIFGDESIRLARVAVAAHAQGIYPQIHDAMMRESSSLTDAILQNIVMRHGGDWAQIVSTRDGRKVAAQLERNRSDALRLGVGATPTYLIGPYKIVGALSEAEFTRAIAQARAHDKSNAGEGK